jgi:hypothetical protein
MTESRTDASTAEIKIRMKEPLRAQIEREAEIRGVSMNAEMIARLEHSYHKDESLDAALAFAYGEETAALLLVIAKVMEQAEAECSWVCRLARGEARGAYWAADPYFFDQTALAINRAFEALRPPGDPSGPARDDGGADLSAVASTAGTRAAAAILDSLIAPSNAMRRLGKWAKPIAKKLGPGLVKRLRQTERASGKTMGDRIVKAKGAK